VAAAPAEQAERYREDARDAGGHYHVEAEAELDVERVDVGGRVRLVELHELLRHQVAQTVDRHARTHCKHEQM